MKGGADYLLEDEQGLSMGGLLTLVKWTLLLPFILDNHMNIASLSSIIPNNRVIFTYGLGFGAMLIFAGKWPKIGHFCTRLKTMD